MSGGDCACVLLASGLSARFGRENKLLAPLSGKMVIEHTLAGVQRAGFGAYYAVIGPQDGAILTHKLVKAGFEIITNPAPQNGQGSSLSLGASAAIAGGFERICVALADMPCVPSAHYRALLKLSQNSNRVISETVIDGHAVTLPPAIFSGDAAERLVQASGDNGAKAYLRGADVASQKLSYWNAKDIDTPADLQALERHMQSLATS